MSDTRTDEAPWPLRAVMLMVLGAAAGLAIHLLTKSERPWDLNASPARLAAAAGIASGSIAFAFALERARMAWTLVFAGAVGIVVGFVTWSNGPWNGWGANEGWQLFSALLAVAIAVPLFQTARDAGRISFDYQRLHAHSWTNIVLWFAAWGFTLVTWLLALLLSELFNLIGIHVLRDLLNKGWFELMLTGAAFGLGAGLFRDRDRVLETLQRVVTAILAVLTPVLALGLVLFVLSLPFTGLEPLWTQTKQTTPVLLVCILGAFLLVNATIGPEEEPRPAWLRHSAMGLAAVMLPLAIVAAISIGKRIGQYGLTPERLWAVVFVLVALSAGLLYFGAIVRRRLGWAADVRRANIGLALGVCGLALLLALPVLSFGAISARNQVARLHSGKVTPEKLDWAALRYDFGPAGRRTVERLARQAPDPTTRKLAARILLQQSRWEVLEVQEAAAVAARPRQVKVLPPGTRLPPEMSDFLFAMDNKPQQRGLCVRDGGCLVSWTPGADTAVVLFDPCLPYSRPGAPILSGPCRLDSAVIARSGTGWRVLESFSADTAGRAGIGAERRAALAGQVELREVKGLQVFVGGRPIGAPVSPAQPPAK